MKSRIVTLKLTIMLGSYKLLDLDAHDAPYRFKYSSQIAMVVPRRRCHVRDNLKTMSRRTWCTAKRPDRLQYLMYIYAWRHQQKLDKVPLSRMRV